MSKWIAALLALSLAMPVFAAKNTGRDPGRDPGEFSVISYHDVIDLDQTPDMKIFPQTITRNLLVKHFNLIAELGYHPVSYQQIIDAREGKQPLPEKAILLTFDDGYRSFYEIVYPLLKLYDYPAITAVVGSWLDVPAGQRVPYGDTTLPRERFMTWDELREMQQSPLVEIASHTYDLHKGIIGNPFGNQQPAATTSAWSPSGYESESEYVTRIRNDMQTTRQRFQDELGKGPRIMIWPYGAYSNVTLELAAEAGMPHTFSLLGHVNNVQENPREMGRYLIDQETSLETIEEILADRTWERDVERIVHVDLDYVYDEDEVQQGENLDVLLDRVKKQGVSTVYLQAYADADGNGVAEALYFPNRHMPMKADLFNRVAWQLKKRAGVKVYAWMPVMAFDLGEGYQYIVDARHGQSNPDYYRRLSPYDENNRRIIREIYEDLGRMTKFDSLLFHDDGLLNDFEDANPAALQWYAREWNLPGSVTQIRQDETKMAEWTRHKTQSLIDFTHELRDAADHYRQHDNKRFLIARNIYAPVVLEPESEAWFAQNLEEFGKAYDYTAVMAMPYMEGAKDTDHWLRRLASEALEHVPAERLVFELQAMDWRDQSPVPSETLAHWMQVIRSEGIDNYGYYPDDFINGHPETSVLRRDFSLTAHLGDAL
ncbi:poly-beta-1,6-N-acetyl-D-glucosamine N-deacetylase PgaB [Modicisalibacter luteus]|uniref:Poly-beta-1,6-N-acetyl-D-glucosamine N-deacetylase PgaB n=1 Tax=Modicisalibacter luteus TaxID=453962 RepID=A0ABV7M1I7_9GAMM|nr:poly-beta-1,6-N-acetyl-D-glucosamine N-deacetylase PgaB [Halomonas lutea]GHB08778.1 poly-beta-1,6-N-acetyl-D-glucosamine N-deacetylase PgaB [Halomonas lutea]